jgi:hypothetical protein
MAKNTVKQGKKEFRIADKNEQVWTLFKEIFPQAEYFHEIDGRAVIDIVWVEPMISKSKPIVVKKGGVGEKLYGGADFRIDIGTEIWGKLNDDQRKYLLLHAANHLAGGENKSGEFKFRLNRHDFGDFNINMERYGSDVRQEIARANYELYKDQEKDNEQETLKIDI